MSKYQLLPPLSTAQYEALKADIEVNGVRVPVEVDEDGEILDGHHRAQAAAETGMPEPPRRIVAGLSEIGKQAYVLAQNLHRRHLSPEQWGYIRKQQRELARQLADAGKTQDEIAKVVGVTRQAVSQWLGDISNASTCTAYIPDQRLTIPRPARQEIEERLEAGEPQAQIAADFNVTQPRISQIATKAKERKARAAIAAAEPIPALIRQGDAVALLTSMAPRSIRLLLTDPPYMTDVDDIAAFAASWVPMALSRLADDGRAFIFTGCYVDEVHAYLNIIEDYGDLGGSQLLVWYYPNTLGPSPRNEYKTAHQVIHYLYGKNAPKLDAPVLTESMTVHELSTPASSEGGNLHRWQKPIALAERFIKQASQPGDLLVDPFAGTGTFLLAASKLGRRALGAEIDPEMIQIALGRGCRRE